MTYLDQIHHVSVVKGLLIVLNEVITPGISTWICSSSGMDLADLLTAS